MDREVESKTSIDKSRILNIFLASGGLAGKSVISI